MATKEKHRAIIEGYYYACRAFAEKMGWTICKEYMEKGISGFKISANDRDAINKLFLYCEINVDKYVVPILK